MVFLFPFWVFGQNVIVPIRFEFQKDVNEFKLSSWAKKLVERQGFRAFFENNVPTEVLINNCNNLRINVINSSGFLSTKLHFVLVDCKGEVVFTSEEGKSSEKSFETAYQEALKMAFSGKKLAEFKQNYKGISAESNQIKTDVTNSLSTLYAQSVAGGFQLVDNNAKVTLRIQKTSLTDIYIAEDEQGNKGILYKKDTIYIFEYQQDSVLKQRLIDIKF